MRVDNPEPTAADRFLAVKRQFQAAEWRRELTVACRGSTVDPVVAERVALAQIRGNPDLTKCSPSSVFKCVLTACSLGLEPDGVRGLAYLIPFKNNRLGRYDCNLVIGYPGLTRLAWNVPELSELQPILVHEKDTFRYEPGASSPITHRVHTGTDRGEVIAAYTRVRFRGHLQFLGFLWIDEINAIRDKAPSSRSSKSPWNDKGIGERGMRLKTTLRQACKHIPGASQLERAVAIDEAADAGIQALDAPGFEVVDVSARGEDRDPFEPALAEVFSEADAGVDASEIDPDPVDSDELDPDTIPADESGEPADLGAAQDDASQAETAQDKPKPNPVADQTSGGDRPAKGRKTARTRSSKTGKKPTTADTTADNRRQPPTQPEQEPIEEPEPGPDPEAIRAEIRELREEITRAHRNLSRQAVNAAMSAAGLGGIHELIGETPVEVLRRYVEALRSGSDNGR